MNVDMIGVPIDLGSNRRGVDMGPSAIRYAGLKSAVSALGVEYNDLGNIDVRVPENYEKTDTSRMRYIDEINRVNKTLADMVAASISRGSLPVILGGDHSIAAGAVLGTQYVLHETGVIWMDAHGDYNTENTTLSGNLHGMSLAACTGAGAQSMVSFRGPHINFINPRKVVLIGTRSLDPEEAVLIKDSGMTVFTMSDIDIYGMKDVMKKTLEIVENGTEGFHFSFDMDVISPSEAPGVGTPVKGGITYREAHLAAEMVSDSRKLRSAEFVEVNPIIDNMNQTSELAVSLICSMLGQKILRL